MSLQYPKILAADDDMHLLKALSLRLWDLGYEMITATDSNQVLLLMRESHPDLLVLDVNIPPEDGFSIHEQVKKIDGFSAVPVIYLTGDASPRLETFAKELGAVALFRKPFQLKELVATIDMALKSRASQQPQEASSR